MSHPIFRRRVSRAFALTVTTICAALVAPAAALADGQLDPAFNGTGYHVGSAAEGTIFSNTENRIPMIVQADGKIVAGGSRGGSMTLVRYNANGTIDSTFGTGGFVTRQFGGTPSQTTGSSGAVAMTQDASGNIFVAGFGGSQSMVVARFTAAGAFGASAVCYAPHLIDYTARALALRPNGSIVLVGYGRDRHASAAVPPTGPAVLYGLRAIVTLPLTGNSTTACGTYSSAGGLSLGSNGVAVDGVNPDGSGADPARAGRFYDAVVALPDNRYVLGSTNGPDGAAWVQRYTAAGAIDNTFAGGRLVLPTSAVHAMALLGDGSILAAGETVDAVSANRHMQVARITSAGGMAAWGTGGFARSRVAGGNNTGQAIAVLGDGSVIVGGSANLAGKTAFALTRFTPAGARDDVFGTHGETTTPFGAPAVNGYITGMALTGNLLAVSGRLTNAAGLVVTAARYYATGAPPPPPPPPAASTLGVDGITATGARVTGTINANGTAATWWLEYGPTTAYGTKSAAQALAATTNDLDVGVNVTGLNPGTLYHARLVISNSIGTTPGDDVTFTTLGGSGAGGATPAGPGGKGAKKVCRVPKVVGKKLNVARKKIFASGCKAKVVYKKSKRPKNIVLAQSRKAKKKLVYRAVVKLTVSTKQTPKTKSKSKSTAKQSTTKAHVATS
ncbi:MAG: hypothetical protein QOD65_1293 [Gaiellales bacterium]|nr:hypothetical protein [Gaiellales bacterium]